VYEDKEYLAFLDIGPVNKGHTLIVPKKHFRWVYDVADQGSYWAVAQKVARSLIKNFNAEYVMFVTWGEEVHHAHIHVIPRFKDDGHQGFPDFQKKKTFSSDEMKEISEKVRC
jgi:histidine triad (HIT) family protein